MAPRPINHDDGVDYKKIAHVEASSESPKTWAQILTELKPTFNNLSSQERWKSMIYTGSGNGAYYYYGGQGSFYYMGGNMRYITQLHLGDCKSYYVDLFGTSPLSRQEDTGNVTQNVYLMVLDSN